MYFRIYRSILQSIICVTLFLAYRIQNYAQDLNVRYALGSETCAHAPLANVDCGTMIPQVWWLPSEVWEIRGAGKLSFDDNH